jgi:peptidoglycan/LPS O-acetylase OafA/YrhL
MDRLLGGGTIPGNRVVHCIVTILLFGMIALLYKCSHLFGLSDILAKMLGVVFLNATTIYLCCVIIYCFQLLKIRSQRLLKLLNLVGSVSFAVYCIHEPLLVLLEKSVDLGYPIIRFLLYLVITFSFSWCLSVFGRKIIAVGSLNVRSIGKA